MSHRSPVAQAILATLAEHPNSTVEQLTQFADIGCSAPFGNLPDLERQGLATGTAGAGALAAGPTAGAWPMASWPRRPPSRPRGGDQDPAAQSALTSRCTRPSSPISTPWKPNPTASSACGR